MKPLVVSISLLAIGCVMVPPNQEGVVVTPSVDEMPRSSPTMFVYLDGEQLGLQRTPSVQLTSSEVDGLVSVARSLGAPRDYLFGGCESRAHALWQILPDGLQQKVGKVWLIPFDQYTYLPLTGILRPVGSERVRWSYHVALRFLSGPTKTPMVLDLAFGSVPVPQEQWLKLLTIPPATLLLSTNGQQFSFNREMVGCDARGASGAGAVNCWNRDRQLINGNFFPYEFHHADDDIRSNLARDAAGALLLSTQSCSALEALVEQPIDLRDALKAMASPSAAVPEGCGPIVDAYRSEWSRIDQLLHLVAQGSVQ